MVGRTDKPTKAESERMDLMVREIGCIVTRARSHIYRPPEIHHIIEGNRRLGHWWSIPLAPWYHRGVCDTGMSKADMERVYGPSLAHGSKPFEKYHGTQRALWEVVQGLLGLPIDGWPASKIVPRRCA